MAKKMIIDVDTGVDDAEAMMLALSRPEVEVIGITTVNINVAVDVCRNTLRVLKICGRLDVSLLHLCIMHAISFVLFVNVNNG